MATRSLEALHSYGVKHLTAREIEILKWTAVGKTAGDIAIILSMKERTVHFHVANAVQKMGACNKTSAVVQAALSGIFYLTTQGQVPSDKKHVKSPALASPLFHGPR